MVELELLGMVDSTLCTCHYSNGSPHRANFNGHDTLAMSIDNIRPSVSTTKRSWRRPVIKEVLLGIHKLSFVPLGTPASNTNLEPA